MRVQRSFAMLAAFAVAFGVATADAVPTRAAPPDDAPILRAGDRVVFLGDSITEQKIWTKYVAQAVTAVHPDFDIRFFNAGWGGDVAPRARERLARDVLALDPTLVTIFFGMNDGGYRGPDANVAKTFRDGLAGIVADLKAKNVRVVVMSPGCVDAAGNQRLEQANYNATLEALAKVAGDVARESQVPFIDVHHPMLDAIAAHRAVEPGHKLLPDGVHPDADGHRSIAAAVLRGLGVPQPTPLGTWDAKLRRGRGLAAQAGSADLEILLATTEKGPPLFGCEAGAQAAMRTSSLLDIVGRRLTVTGLAKGSWEVSSDDSVPATFTDEELEKGVAICAPGGTKPLAIAELVSRREATYFAAWRTIRLPMEGVAGVDEAWKGLLALDLGVHRAIAAACAPTITNLRIAPAPDGPNIAAGKKYDCTDPNPSEWATGLTDGSWAPDQGHCFATNNGAKYPKSVVVDLEKAARVNFVRLGVPGFGSTKTIEVALSADGKAWEKMATTEMPQRRAERRTLAFTPYRARFVRLTFTDHWRDEARFPAEYAFVTELEVYAARSN